MEGLRNGFYLCLNRYYLGTYVRKAPLTVGGTTRYLRLVGGATGTALWADGQAVTPSTPIAPCPTSPSPLGNCNRIRADFVPGSSPTIALQWATSASGPWSW